MIVEPHIETWMDLPEATVFPIQNLPYGVFSDPAGTRCGVAIGDAILDLARAESAGLFANTGLERDTFRTATLNAFLGHNRGVWSSVRSRIVEVLNKADREGERFCRTHDLIVSGPVTMRLPVEVGDFVDFYSSEHHATNVGRMFRPDGAPLLDNWKHLPVGYHGRAGTVVGSGTDIQRPHGQRTGPNGPEFGPTRKLDYELEVGFVTGRGPELGGTIHVDEAEHHIFGVVLVNDWSARDIQAWEYAPLGPFLGKSFATTVSPWVVPLDALAPFRGPAPVQVPEPLPYLREGHRSGIDIDLRVEVHPRGATSPTTTAHVSFLEMYWTMAQQLAHATVNGATVRPGDLFGSGTVSGPSKESVGSLLEASWNGTDPVAMVGGQKRTFLEDGDTVRMTGQCTSAEGVRIGFGECLGTIVA